MDNFFKLAHLGDIQEVLQARGILCMAAPTPQGQPVHTATMTMTQTAPVQTTTNQSGVQPMFAAQQDGSAGTHGNSGSSQGGGGGGQRPTGNLQPPVVETEASRSKALQQNGQNNVDPSGQTAPTMDKMATTGGFSRAREVSQTKWHKVQRPWTGLRATTLSSSANWPLPLLLA